jgi:hypothetical protein
MALLVLFAHMCALMPSRSVQVHVCCTVAVNCIQEVLCTHAWPGIDSRRWDASTCIINDTLQLQDQISKPCLVNAPTEHGMSN